MLTDLERFERNFEKSEGCWTWCGATNRQGYGLFSLGFGSRGAHRAAWLLYKGVITSGFMVLHNCGNSGCVNPEHLYLGTHLDNMRDRKEHGTVHKAFGEKHHRAALTQAQADEIRRILKEERKTQTEVAQMFGVSRALVGLIANDRRYVAATRAKTSLVLG